MMPEDQEEINYSEHPKSVAEIKANKNSDGALWKPRDALISLLRDIDSGKIEVTDIVILWACEKEQFVSKTGYRASCRSVLNRHGLIEIVKTKMLEDFSC